VSPVSTSCGSDITVNVPEPDTLALAGLGAMRRRKG
jgi:hypothetical protein